MYAKTNRRFVSDQSNQRHSSDGHSFPELSHRSQPYDGVGAVQQNACPPTALAYGCVRSDSAPDRADRTGTHMDGGRHPRHMLCAHRSQELQPTSAPVQLPTQQHVIPIHFKPIESLYQFWYWFLTITSQRFSLLFYLFNCFYFLCKIVLKLSLDFVFSVLCLEFYDF